MKKYYVDKTTNKFYFPRKNNFIQLSPNPILMYNGGEWGSQSAIGIFTIFHISAVHQLWIWTK